MKRGIVLGVLLATGGISLAATGFQGREGRGPQGPNVAEIEKVNDRLYMITGGGGNTAAFITDAGVVLVDTKLANWGQAILDKVKSVTNKPITTIINTHTHGDHNGSNEFFGASVEFVAQENTKTNMEKMDAFKGDKSVFIPKKTFKDKLTLGKGTDQIDLYYFGRAHTNGDAWVVFPALRAMHSGDAFAGKNDADHRREQRRQRGRLRQDDHEGGVERQERGHDHHRPQPEDDDGGPEGIRRLQRRTSSSGCRARSRRARPWTRPPPNTSSRNSTRDTRSARSWAASRTTSRSHTTS